MSRKEIKRVAPKQKYGKLTVINRDTENPNRKPYWICQCDCGKKTSVRADYLTSGTIASCGCLRLEKFLITDQNIETCKRLFEEGLSIEKISQRMRVSPCNVQKFLSELGVKISISKKELSNYRKNDKLRWAKKYIGFGMSLSAIAQAENTTTASVSVALTKMGIPLREPGSQSEQQKSYFQAKAQEYWQFYESGLSLNQIAKIYDTYQESVRYILLAHGYTLRTLSEANKNRHKRKRIGFRKEVRQLILERGIKLSETKKRQSLEK